MSKSKTKAECKCGSEYFYTDILPDNKEKGDGDYTEIWKCLDCGRIYKAYYKLIAFRELGEERVKK